MLSLGRFENAIYTALSEFLIMAMTWDLVKEVIQSINTSRETAIKIGTENAHEDYIFVTEK